MLLELGIGTHVCNPALGRLMQEDGHEFKTTMGYTE